LPLGKFIFLHLVVMVSIDFSISFLAPAALIAVRAAFPHVRVFFPGLGRLSSFYSCPMRIWFCRWGGPIAVVVCICWCLQRCVPFFLTPLGSQLLHWGALPYGSWFWWGRYWPLLWPFLGGFVRFLGLYPRLVLWIDHRFARVPSPTHLLMVFRRDSLSVR
jgi:hypothetical protein